uniref:Uncharacterized protein n=1 Tax=Anguilla anguilla TaxID=7936 RepID=A0A0E9S4J3_ANGAN
MCDFPAKTLINIHELCPCRHNKGALYPECLLYKWHMALCGEDGKKCLGVRNILNHFVRSVCFSFLII